MKKKSLKGKRILLVLNLTTMNLEKNENLITSKIIKYVNFLTSLGVETVTLDKETDYDIIVTQHEDNLIGNSFSKPAIVFHYCGLNGGFFYEQFLELIIPSSTKYFEVIKPEISNVSTLNITKIKNIKN